jgi:prepilin-type N-terminal cleavage/methylation domain-containing protein
MVRISDGHSCSQFGWPPRRAFTLIELLVVIAIIAVLVGLLLPAVQKVREAANRMSCSNNLKQLALGVHTYHDANTRFPANSIYTYDPTAPNWSWLCRIMPYVEQGNLYNQTNAGGNPPNNINQSLAQIVIPVKLFLCPSDPDADKGPVSYPSNYDMFDPVLGPLSYYVSCYRACVGSNWGGGPPGSPLWWGTDPQWCNPSTVNGSYDGCANGDGVIWENNKPLRITDVTDGTSNTFMIGEALCGKDYMNSWCHMDNPILTCALAPNAKSPVTGQDYPPTDWWNRYGATSDHLGGVQFALTDGSVHFISNTIDLTLYRALGTRQGGEIASVP